MLSNLDCSILKELDRQNIKSDVISIVMNRLDTNDKKNDFLSFLDNGDWNDLEDALQLTCAEKSNLDYIITRDKENGFKNSPVKTISPVDFLQIKFLNELLYFGDCYWLLFFIR